MAQRNMSHITSTPEEYCFKQSSFLSSLAEDSGYHSNSSGYVSSTNLSSLNHSKISDVHLDSINEHENGCFGDEAISTPNLIEDPRQFNIWKQRFPIASPKLNLTGKKYVDFFYYLGDRFHHTIILKKILSDLSDEDLYNSALVSKSWRQVINSIPSEEKRLRSHLKKVKSTKENLQIYSAEKNSVLENARCLTIQTPRNMLMQIQNIRESASSSSASPPTSKHTYRFEAYQKEARKLKIGKRLFSCPKCNLPSHIDPKTQNTAECTNSSCKYRFCILCECEEHLYKLCDFISTPIVRKQTTNIGTAKSKKNLKRLLL